MILQTALKLILKVWVHGLLDTRVWKYLFALQDCASLIQDSLSWLSQVTLSRIQQLNSSKVIALISDFNNDQQSIDQFSATLVEALSQLDVQLGTVYHGAFNGLNSTAQAVDSIWSNHQSAMEDMSADARDWLKEATVHGLLISNLKHYFMMNVSHFHVFSAVEPSELKYSFWCSSQSGLLKSSVWSARISIAVLCSSRLEAFELMLAIFDFNSQQVMSTSTDDWGNSVTNMGQYWLKIQKILHIFATSC